MDKKNTIEELGQKYIYSIAYSYLMYSIYTVFILILAESLIISTVKLSYYVGLLVFFGMVLLGIALCGLNMYFSYKEIENIKKYIRDHSKESE